jgi:hypothetical protein
MNKIDKKSVSIIVAATFLVGFFFVVQFASAVFIMEPRPDDLTADYRKHLGLPGFVLIVISLTLWIINSKRKGN